MAPQPQVGLAGGADVAAVQQAAAVNDALNKIAVQQAALQQAAALQALQAAGGLDQANKCTLL